eukprot:5779649-Prymnesium_polylepis.1
MQRQHVSSRTCHITSSNVTAHNVSRFGLNVGESGEAAEKCACAAWVRLSRRDRAITIELNIAPACEQALSAQQ